MQIWTYANALTASRIVLAPVFIICFMADGAAGKFAAFAIACLFEVTDLLDGYLARSRGEVTGIGKLIDPLADSISRFSVFLCLLARDYVPVWMIAIIFYRDAMVSYIRVGAAAHEVVLAARTTGKIKAICQGIVTVSVTGLIAAQAAQWIELPVRDITWWAMAAVTAVTVLAGIDYLVAFSRIVRQKQATAR
jgi:CDP-diacylglycerol--glycerol-3-phosphate 3-phosphatidyltransferase